VADLDDGGLLTLYMACYDPATGMAPVDAFAGFLPPDDPDDIDHRGEGHISYMVRPDAGLPTGREISNQATIVFDFDPPIDTNTTLNTIDVDPPASTVVGPSTTNDIPLILELVGNDGGSSEIATYDVYVSVDGLHFGQWLTTTASSVSMNGRPGHTYAFYSVATDAVGNVEAAPTEPDLTVTVLLPGDADEDGDVDLADYIVFADCLAGPGTLPAPTMPGITVEDCLDTFDSESDFDVDLADWARVQSAITD
jgi:hypothetical protein